MKLRDFCFAADANYSMPLQVAVASLLWALRGVSCSVTVHVLDLGIGDSSWNNIMESWQCLIKRILLRGGEVLPHFERHKIDGSQFKEFMLWHGSVAPYGRLLLPILLPHVKWCLYSDCDVLFVENPLVLEEYCASIDMSCAGSKNPLWLDSVEFDWFKKNQLDVTRLGKYICTGFLLMNLEWFRKNDITSKALSFLSRYSTTSSADQCAINYLCHSTISLLPKRWGIFNSEITNESGGAIHYAGGLPWRASKGAVAYLGNNPAISKLWRDFAIRIACIKSSDLRISVKEVIYPKLKALILRGMFAARLFHSPKYNKAFSVSDESVVEYNKELFGTL